MRKLLTILISLISSFFIFMSCKTASTVSQADVKENLQHILYIAKYTDSKSSLDKVYDSGRIANFYATYRAISPHSYIKYYPAVKFIGKIVIADKNITFCFLDEKEQDNFSKTYETFKGQSFTYTKYSLSRGRSN